MTMSTVDLVNKINEVKANNDMFNTLNMQMVIDMAHEVRNHRGNYDCRDPYAIAELYHAFGILLDFYPIVFDALRSCNNGDH